MEREKGVVKWFSTEKGYGFIRRESGEEVFVHHTDIDVEGYASLRNGESVEFEIFNSDRGPKARKLVPLEAPEDLGAQEAAATEPDERGRSRGGRRTSEGRGASKAREGSGQGSLRPLAQQLREKLGGRFPGFGG